MIHSNLDDMPCSSMLMIHQACCLERNVMCDSQHPESFSHVCFMPCKISRSSKYNLLLEEWSQIPNESEAPRRWERHQLLVEYKDWAQRCHCRCPIHTSPRLPKPPRNSEHGPGEKQSSIRLFHHQPLPLGMRFRSFTCTLFEDVPT